MESIVLGFDGTDTAVVALDWVGERAAHRAAQVEIVMIAAAPVEEERSREARLREAERRLRDHAPAVAIDAHRLPGRMPDSLLRRASSADILVVGARRGHTTRSELPGWMPLRVASQSSAPVVVVPRDWEPFDGKIVVGVDGDSSAAAVELASREAAASRVPLVMVHTWRTPPPVMEGAVTLLASPIEARAEHLRHFHEVVQQVRAAHPDLVVEQVFEQSSPSAALLAASRTASMVVVGSRRRGRDMSARLGSVGQDVLSQSRVPVWVVPTPNPE